MSVNSKGRKSLTTYKVIKSNDNIIEKNMIIYFLITSGYHRVAVLTS